VLDRDANENISKCSIRRHAYTNVRDCDRSDIFTRNSGAQFRWTKSKEGTRIGIIFASCGNIVVGWGRLDMVSVVEISMSKPNTNSWDDYKRVRKRAVIWTLVFFFGSEAISYASIRFFGSPILGFAFAFASMAVALFSIWRLITWSCPRCGETFGLFRHCRHCRLLKWGEWTEQPR